MERKEINPMNELQKYQPKLPASYQRHLAKGTDNMTSIARLTSQALAQQGHVFGYAMFEALKTLTMIEALKKAFPASAMDPETKSLLNNLTQDYLVAMQMIPQEASRKILQVLENASVPPEEEGLLDSITSAFTDWLNS